jgi:aminoglycoside 3-N-acetyltransferase
MQKQIVTTSELKRAVVDLELSGLPVCVHASLRSFGWVEGGANAIVDTLLRGRCTVMVPAFSWAFSIPPPTHLRPARNGIDYDLVDRREDVTMSTYTPDSNEIDDYLGAIAKAVLARRGRARSSHPINSFAAVGPLANDLVARQTTVDVYAPLEALAAAGGVVVLMGVGLESMTLLHLAERRGGRTLFRRWALDGSGDPMMVAVGGCSNGFPRLEPMLASTRGEHLVGASRWQVFHAASALEAATEAIRNDPEVTRCADAECKRCRDGALGGPLLAPSQTT